MCIETRSWDTYRALPIVIIVALVVSELPELILSKSSVIGNHEVLGGSNSSTSNVLRNYEEFKIIGHDVFGNDCSWWWVVLSCEEPIVDSLVHSNLSKLWIVVLSKGFEALLDFWNFNIHDELDLGLSYTISVEDDHFWKTFVLSLICF